MTPARATTPAGTTAPVNRAVLASTATDQPAVSLPAAIVDAPGPSTAYEQAMAHADDDLDFTPGGQVTVGFTPRAGEGWLIDGQAPVALPAGKVTGRDMAAASQGSTWAEPGAGDASAPDEGGGSSDSGRDAPGGGPAASDNPGEPVATPEPADPAAPTEVGDTADPIDPVDPANPAGAGNAIPATSASWVPAPPAAAEAPREPDAASGLRRLVFGFLPYWELSNASSKLNYDVISTIAYFSVGASGAGNLRKKDADGSATTGWGGWTSNSMTRVINDAHARGTRVVLTISVFAWTSSQAAVQRQLLGSSAARSNLARQAAAAVRDRGADGVNLDFEPLASGYEREFVALLKSIRAELNKVKKGYQLTYDTTGYIGNYPLEASIADGAADAIFVMGYDYRTSGSSSSGSIDPLSGRTYDLTDTVRAYTSRVAPSKVILGLPWYGRAWSTDSDEPRADNISGAKYGYSTAVNYETLAPLVTKHGRRWDGVEQSPYIAYRRENCTSTYGCVTSWRQVWYDDAQSTKLRLAMVNDYGLRGAGMWALGYDGGHAELYRAFAESFLIDKSAPQAGVRGMSGTQPDEGFVVSWTARDASSIASYDVQVSVDGGAWSPWLSATKATSEVYPGRGGRGYAFRVRARDAKGNAGEYTTPQVWTASPELESGGFGRVVQDGLAYRSGPGTETVRLGSLPEGTIVAITRGPVVEDGYTWFEVTQPIKEWSPVSFVERGVWVAASGGGDRFIKPHRSPASTRVDAGIAGLDFGPAGAAGTGSSPEAVAIRSFSPGKDGSEDGLRIRWTSAVQFDTLKLRVFRASGELAGSVQVGATGAGDKSMTWDGRIDGSKVADGRYQLQLVGTACGTTYTAPSARPVTAAQLDRFAVTVDTVPPAFSSVSAGGRLISPNGDGTLDLVKLALATTGGASRWTITIAWHLGVRGAHGLGHGVVGRSDLGRQGRRGQSRPRRPLHRHARSLRRGGQPGREGVPDHRGHDGAVDHPDGDAGRLRAQRRWRAGDRDPRLDGQRGRLRHGAHLQGHHARPLVADRGPGALGGRVDRQAEGRDAGGRWRLLPQGRCPRCGGQPADGDGQNHRGPDGAQPALGRGVLPAGRRCAAGHVPCHLRAGACRDHVAAPLRRARHACADGLDRTGAARR